VVITEVRIKLMEDNNENERLQAFCSVTFDDAYGRARFEDHRRNQRPRSWRCRVAS